MLVKHLEEELQQTICAWFVRFILVIREFKINEEKTIILKIYSSMYISIESDHIEFYIIIKEAPTNFRNLRRLLRSCVHATQLLNIVK